jgi:hypothetical protein
MRIQNFHLPSCRSAQPGVERRQKDSKDRAPEPLPALGALRGALAFRVRLENGLSHTIERPTSVPVALGPCYHQRPPGFMPRGSAKPVGD